jgi:hypothetical protein
MDRASPSSGTPVWSRTGPRTRSTGPAIKDEGTGFSTWTSKGYAVFGLGGFSIGAIIGLLVS